MADSQLIDSAVITLLANDAALKTLCPGGVYFDLAPAGVTSYVSVTLADSDDRTGGGINRQVLYERLIYGVKAVVQSSGGTVARDAAARIHVLLQWTLLDLTAAGYTTMTIQRIRRLRYPERDPVQPEILWQHRGGQYEVFASPN